MPLAQRTGDNSEAPSSSADVFQDLFGGFSNSLSLFSNNPYQRKNSVAADSDTTVLEPLHAKEKAPNGKSERKKKKDVGEQVNINGGAENAGLHTAEKKKKKKKVEYGSSHHAGGIEAVDNVPNPGKVHEKSAGLKVSEEADTVPTAVLTIELKDRKAKVSGREVKKLENKKRGMADHKVAPNGSLENIDANLSTQKSIISHKEREKKPKRKVVEDLEENFEKRLRGVGDKIVKSKAVSHVPNVHSEDREIDEILLASGPVKDENNKGKRKHMDEEDDGLGPKKQKKTKHQYEEEEKKLLRTIFVGNLPTTVKRKQLVREFSQFGVVESTRLRSVALVDTKLPRKAAVITGQLNETRSSLNAYVVFESEATAKAALVHNMSEFQGKHIRVDMATAPRKDIKPGSSVATEYDRTRSIFVGNVPFDVEDEDLYAVFANDNPELGVEGIRVPRDPTTSISKGFCFVLFKTKAGATAALAKKSAKLGDRNLRVVRMGNQQRLSTSSRPTSANQGRSTSNIPASRLRSAGQVYSTPTKGPLPWEGTRSTKSDGRPGKWTLARPDSRKPGAGGGKTSGASGPVPKTRLSKRPAVAARKQAALVKAAGGVPVKPKIPKKLVGKRKKGDKGRKGGPKAKKPKK